MAAGIRPEGWEVPWYVRIVQVAKYYHCSPEEIMSMSSFWLEATQIVAEAEAHAREVQQQRSN